MVEQSYLFMSDLQVLGHGFYSDLGPVLIEYGWLIELRINDITAEMSTSDVMPSPCKTYAVLLIQTISYCMLTGSVVY